LSVVEEELGRWAPGCHAMLSRGGRRSRCVAEEVERICVSVVAGGGGATGAAPRAAGEEEPRRPSCQGEGEAGRLPR
jgi:hypothetical protein